MSKYLLVLSLLILPGCKDYPKVGECYAFKGSWLKITKETKYGFTVDSIDWTMRQYNKDGYILKEALTDLIQIDCEEFDKRSGKR